MKSFFVLLAFASAWGITPPSKKLNIFAYSSFISAWGPGPKIIQDFKEQCHCEVEISDMGDSNLVIDKLARLKNRDHVDVVVGLDQISLLKAKKKLAWLPVKFKNESKFAGADSHFVAFDWSPMTFVYRKSSLAQPPKTLDDLLSENLNSQILLEDPRLSTVGMQFLAWVYLSKKEKALDFLRQLKKQIHSVSPSWSMAYGLFKKEQAKLVFSYLSSPVYHWKEEKDESFQPVAFSEKLPLQVEWAGIPENCGNCKLASTFIEYLLSEKSQKLLMDLNYMFPVRESLIANSLYEKLPKIHHYSPADYRSVQPEKLLKLWKEIYQ